MVKHGLHRVSKRSLNLRVIKLYRVNLFIQNNIIFVFLKRKLLEVYPTIYHQGLPDINLIHKVTQS